MSPELQAILIAAMSTLGGGFMGWLSYRINMRKTRAEAASIIEEAAGKMVKKMEVRLDDVEKELEDTKCKLVIEQNAKTNLERRIKTLEDVIIVKDGKIAELIREGIEKDIKIASLEKRVAELESELSKIKDGTSSTLNTP